MTNGIGRVGWRNFVSAAVPNNNPLWNNLLAYYTADNTTNDAKGTNNATLVNGATYGTGKIGSGFQLDGINDYVSIPNGTFNPTSGDYTISAWMSISTTSYLPVIFGLGGFTNNSIVVYLYGGLIRFLNSNSGIYQLIESPIPSSGSYHHILCVKDTTSNKYYLYVNGSLVAQATISINYVASNLETRIGSIGNGAGGFSPFAGIIDEVGLWNRALTAAEATELYNAGTGKQYGAPVVTTTSSAPTVSYLLDTYGGSAVSYSLRKLSSTYTGYAIRVRRSSDNTEQNIGFVGNDLDTTALTTFVGSGDGFVTTWYDQSGVNHAVQSTASNQPQIVLSGVINKINNKPAVKFDGLYSSLNLTTSLTFNNSGNLISFVGKRNSIGAKLYSLAGTHYLLALWSDNYYYLQSSTNGYQLSTYPDTTTNQLLLSGVNNGTSQAMYKNNSVVSSTLVNYSLGGYINRIGNYYAGLSNTNSSLQEIIYYNTENSSNLNGINTNINSYYSIY